VVEEEIAAMIKPKGLLIALALLAVLGGLTYWSNKKKAAEGSKPSDSSSKVLTIADDQIKEIKVQKTGAETLVLRRDDAKKWSIAEPKPLPADQDAAGQVATAIASLSADKTVEDKAGDLAPYGLNSPGMTVTVLRKDGKTDVLQIGDETPTGSGNYAKLGGDGKVFTIASFTKSSFDKTSNDLRDKRLLTFDSDKLTRVELNAKGGPVEFGKNNQNDWQILKPRPLRADGSQVEDLVRKLKDAKMEVPASEEEAKKAAAAFAAGTKVATASVTDASGTQSLEVHKDKDKNYYAKSSVVAGIYKVGNDLGDGLDKSADDFRNKKVFDFGFSEPGKVELKTAVYTKNGDKWISAGKTMDAATVQTLIDKLRDLASIKFVDKAQGAPVFEATVTSNDGKRVEKVTITKQENQYFAVRANEPAVYELDSKAVEDLQKAAAEVKEPAPPASKKGGEPAKK
jgi:hypothetical protein